MVEKGGARGKHGSRPRKFEIAGKCLRGAVGALVGGKREVVEGTSRRRGVTRDPRGASRRESWRRGWPMPTTKARRRASRGLCAATSYTWTRARCESAGAKCTRLSTYDADRPRSRSSIPLPLSPRRSIILPIVIDKPTENEKLSRRVSRSAIIIPLFHLAFQIVNRHERNISPLSISKPTIERILARYTDRYETTVNFTPIVIGIHEFGLTRSISVPTN